MINVCLLLIILQIGNVIKRLVNKTPAQLFVYATLGKCLLFLRSGFYRLLSLKGKVFNDYGFQHFARLLNPTECKVMKILKIC